MAVGVSILLTLGVSNLINTSSRKDDLLVSPPPSVSPADLLVVSLAEGNTNSKMGNRRSCAWNRCPSDGVHSRPHMIVPRVLMVSINVSWKVTTNLTSTETEGLWKIQASGDQFVMGQGGDKASGSACYDDDPLRGGSRIDLSDTDYVFAGISVVTITGWSIKKMRTVFDGARLLPDVSTYAAPGNEAVTIPPGTYTRAGSALWWLGWRMYLGTLCAKGWWQERSSSYARIKEVCLFNPVVDHSGEAILDEQNAVCVHSIDYDMHTTTL